MVKKWDNLPINESSKILAMQHVVGDKEYNFIC